jgi:transposase
LTLFLSQSGAPIDNNIVERALKKAILNRRNALFYRTLNGARVGDLFMSLIHTSELNSVNPFEYLTELLRHAEALKQKPSEWMPWNYRGALARSTTPTAA